MAAAQPPAFVLAPPQPEKGADGVSSGSTGSDGSDHNRIPQSFLDWPALPNNAAQPPTVAASGGIESDASVPVPVASSGGWGGALQKKPSSLGSSESIPSRVFGNCNSSKGVTVAVVDANAVISGSNLVGFADKFVSVPEVLREVRDPSSRRRLAFLPFPIETVEPSPDYIKKVVNFSRQTGDLQTLSDVDIKIIALAYMLEAQIHGTDHLRNEPPPLHVVNVKSLPEAQMPGWGSNVSNIEEWEALEKISDVRAAPESKILPLKDLNNQLISSIDEKNYSPVDEDKGSETVGDTRFSLPNKHDNIEGMEVASEINNSKEDSPNTDDWHVAVSRSTQKRNSRRLGKHESRRTSLVGDCTILAASVAAPEFPSEFHEKSSESVDRRNSLDTDATGEDLNHGHLENLDVCNAHDQMMSNYDDFKPSGDTRETGVPGEATKHEPFNSEDSTCEGNSLLEGGVFSDCMQELDELAIDKKVDESVDTIYSDDGFSDASCELRSLSSVACVTSDYAMQNVLLQIGLRLVAPSGMQIRQLHRWVLRCHACNKVAQEIGRIFCPKCGNGGTLRKVSVTVGDNGTILAARRPRTVLRGTKFSLPMPQGGREAITKNPILREDQLPHKFLYPRARKANKEEDIYFSSDSIFLHSGEKREALKPPVRKAVSMFSGRRNPNDNHFSRRKH